MFGNKLCYTPRAAAAVSMDTASKRETGGGKSWNKEETVELKKG